MDQSLEDGNWSLRYDPSEHRVCALTSALSLIAGKEVQAPKLAYPVGPATKFARVVQTGNSLWELLKTFGRERVVLTGETIAWRSGEVEYSTDSVLKHWRRFLKSRQPLFVMPGIAPAEPIAAFLGCDPHPAPRLYISHVNCTLVIMANWGGAPAVLHYGNCSRASADVRNQISGLEIAASDPQIAPLLPKLFADKTLLNGAALSAQTRIPGDAGQFTWRKIDIANEYWLSRKPTSDGETVARLGQRLKLVCSYSPRHRELLLPLADALQEWYETVRIPAGVAHGDFTLGNVLFKGDMLIGIIDWDHVRKDGIPLVDALFMIINSYSGERRIPEGKLFRELWTGEFEDDAFAERIALVRAESGMDKDGLKFLGLMLWFDFLLDRARECAWQPDWWVAGMIQKTVPVAMKWLSRHSRRVVGAVHS